MSKNQHRLIDYLGHILQATGRIEQYTDGLDENGFLRNELIQDAVIRNLEIVGEASRNIERHFPDFAASHPELPLAFAYQMRNAIAHGYFKVDFEIVWMTIQTNLPDFSAQVSKALYALCNELEK